GRFVTADPTVPSPLRTQSWNRYAYVENNPLKFTDPSGFDPTCEGRLCVDVDENNNAYFYTRDSAEPPPSSNIPPSVVGGDVQKFNGGPPPGAEGPPPGTPTGGPGPGDGAPPAPPGGPNPQFMPCMGWSCTGTPQTTVNPNGLPN